MHSCASSTLELQRSDWAGLRAARDRCRAAVTTGRQLWPVATLAEYRLALISPPEWAAPMIDDDAGNFTIGPLTEVIAQHHTWAELGTLLPASPGAAVVAHERVLRGEAVEHDSVDQLPNVFDLPYRLAPWEPSYPLATYSDDGVDAPPPRSPTTPPEHHAADGAAVERLDDDDVELAVRQLVETWTTSSNGRAEIACVAGSADDAVRALGTPAWTTKSADTRRGSRLAGLGRCQRRCPWPATRRCTRQVRRSVGARHDSRSRRRMARPARPAWRPGDGLAMVLVGAGGAQQPRLAAATRRRRRRGRPRLGDQRRRFRLSQSSATPPVARS